MFEQFYSTQKLRFHFIFYNEPAQNLISHVKGSHTTKFFRQFYPTDDLNKWSVKRQKLRFHFIFYNETDQKRISLVKGPHTPQFPSAVLPDERFEQMFSKNPKLTAKLNFLTVLLSGKRNLCDIIICFFSVDVFEVFVGVGDVCTLHQISLQLQIFMPSLYL